MSYIERKPVMVTQLVCNHPRVKYIWEYGGASMIPSDGSIRICIGLKLDNDEIVKFEDDGEGSESGEQKAEKYLDNLQK